MMASLRTRGAILVAAALMVVGASLPAAAVDISASKSIFGKHQWFGGVSGGWVSTSGDDYLTLGVDLGYHLADGLAAGASYEAWLIGDPTVQKLSPWLGYTFWKVKPVQPYVAAFWRQSWISGQDSTQDIGGRAGVWVSRGRSYLGAGLVYEYRLDSEGYLDRDRWYPEVRFAIGF